MAPYLFHLREWAGMAGTTTLADLQIAPLARYMQGWACTTLAPHEIPWKLDHKLDWPHEGRRPRRQNFAFGRARAGRTRLC